MLPHSTDPAPSPPPSGVQVQDGDGLHGRTTVHCHVANLHRKNWYSSGLPSPPTVAVVHVTVAPGPAMVGYGNLVGRIAGTSSTCSWAAFVIVTDAYPLHAS